MSSAHRQASSRELSVVNAIIAVLTFNSVWRPLHHRVEDYPLALCDGSSVETDDLIESDHIRRHYLGSTLYLLNRPSHKWHYWNKQEPDEVIIFKNFDSSSNVKAKCKTIFFDLLFGKGENKNKAYKANKCGSLAARLVPT
jgi:hypothetical protein